MSSQRTREPTMLRRGIPAAALTTLISMAALAGGAGPAAASPRPGTTRHPATAPGTISTIAGGAGGPAKATNVDIGPIGLTISNGHIYIAGAGAVRDVAPSDMLTTPVGRPGGSAGFGGPAAAASLIDSSVVLDHSGNLVIADDYHIAVVAAKTGTFYGQAMTAGHIYSVAGNGKQGDSASGVVATQAPLGGSKDVAVDGNGNLVISDAGFQVYPSKRRFGALLQVVAATPGTFYGQPMTAGDLYTIAGKVGGTGVSGDGGPAAAATLGMFLGTVRIDQAGNLILADTNNSTIRVVAEKTGTFYGVPMTAGDIYSVAGNGKAGYSGDGGPATSAELRSAHGAAPDNSGNLVIADTVNSRIRVVAGSTGTFYGQPMTVGHIYTVAGTGTKGLSGDGGPATSAKLDRPYDVAVDSAGDLAIADAGVDRVRVVAEQTGTLFGQKVTAGDIYSVAGDGTDHSSGDGGPALKAEINFPYAVAASGSGDVAFLDYFDGLVRMVAEQSGTLFGQQMTAGDVYRIAGTGHYGAGGDGGPATKASLAYPQGIAMDAAGNLLIADTDNYRIQVVAVKTGTFYGQAMTAGDIYSVAGTGQKGFSGDGGPATSAGLLAPADVAVDGRGNLLIADRERIRVVAEKTGTFYGVPMTAGNIYTVAGNGQDGFAGDGGPALEAELSDPTGVTADTSGNLVIADNDNSRIRVVAGSTGTFYGVPMTVGDIYSVAGNGQLGFAGDGGPATKAEFFNLASVAVDAAGNLLISDEYNNRVRVVAEKTGTFYGVPMTAGNIYTVAGNGSYGSTGDGGPAIHAGVTPLGATVTPAGNLMIADSSGYIRMVTG